MKKINTSLFLKYIVIGITIVFVAGIISLLTIKDKENKQRTKLLENAHIISASIDVDGLKSLTVCETDLSLSFYKSLKKQLLNIRKSNDSYKFLYLLGQKEDKETIFFFIDSQMPNSPDYVPPGEIYFEASSELVSVFKSQNKEIIGPVTDRWGTMITALIPIVDTENGKLIAVLGLDIIDNKWDEAILKESLPKIGIIVIAILAVVIIFLFKIKTAEEIKSSEEKFRTIFENAPVLIDAFDADGKCILWNNECEKISGYSIDEVNRAKDPMELFYPDENTRAEVIKTITTKPDKKYREWNLHTKDGKILSVLWANFRVSDELVINIGHNITERKQAEKEIKAKQKLNELLLNSMPYPIMLINRKRKVKAANKIAIDTGVKVGDYCWKEFGKCASLSKENLMHVENNPHKPGIQCTFCMMDEMYKTNKPTNDPAVDAFGKIWDTYWIPLNDEEYLHYMIDITERKQAEKELIIAKEKAEESNRLKTAFLNNMSHEIRTPLNGITGFVGLLQNPDLDAEDKQLYIDVINKSSDRLIATVSDIIEISKIEAGIIKVSATKVLVNEVFNELYEFFSLEAENKGLKLKQLPGLSNDKAILLTDNHKLTGILTNLIKNAIKFTDKGSVTFGYSIIEDTEKGSLMQFYVKDTGIGVPDNKLQAIFNRFEQADIGDTRAFEGSGLGLSIAKSYVEALGGKIWLSSKEDIGTEFTFTIPYKTKENMAKKDEIQQELKNKQTNLKDLTVLIAEDEEVNIMLFDAVFKKIFKQIIYVENGQQAIDVCKNNKEIDLILMDIKMPIMNGYTATREIRKFNKDIFIIAQTAFGLEGDREKALETGCDDYISKPLNKEELFEKIEKGISK